MQNNDFLSEEYTIDTPENVTFGYEVVGIGSRFVAALIDTLILFAGLIVLGIVTLLILTLIVDTNVDIESLFTSQDNEWLIGFISAISVLLNFALFWGYFIVFELLWNGQTPGKRVAKIRVVRTDGNPVGFLQSAIRNLVRFVDFMPTAYGFGLITMFFNQNSRRLGDFAAGTIVIRDMGELKINDLVGGNSTQNSTRHSVKGKEGLGELVEPTFSAAMTAPTLNTDPLLTRFENIQAISIGDYELMTDTIARYNANMLDGAVVSRLATAIAKKLKVDILGYGASGNAKFLNEVSEAYRRFQ